MPKSILLAYIPVLHRGYRQWLQKHSQAETLYILGESLIAEFDHLARKDLRALPPKLIASSLSSWFLPFPVKIAEKSDLAELNKFSWQVIAPDEDEIRIVCQKYLDKQACVFESVFLRWDASRSQKKNQIAANVQISHQEFDQQMMKLASQYKKLSSDWWRQIGALIVKDQNVILAGFNRHIPNNYQPYVDGDPRGNFHKGEFIELSTALHAEAGLITEAARQGISLKGSSLYVTTFPCPNCAKLIAYSGIKELFFEEGYSMLDGESILKRQGVKIIQVQTA
jgi:dCMP deaminase